MNILTPKIHRGGLVLQKYSPELLLGAGLVGIAATIVMASKATLKAQSVLDELHNDLLVIEQVANSPLETGGGAGGRTSLYSKEDQNKDKAIAYAQTGLKFSKLYGPSVGVGVLSVAAILASHGIMRNRQVALVAAYNLLAKGFESYRDRVVEELGEEKDLLFKNGLTAEQYTEKEEGEDGKVTKVKKTRLSINPKQHSIYSRFYDRSNPQWRGDRALDKAFLISQQNYHNDVLMIRGHVFLNEVYEALGFPHTKEGAIVGWVLGSNPDRQIGDGYIDFGIFDISDSAGREFINGNNDSILLDFNVDGIIFDLL